MYIFSVITDCYLLFLDDISLLCIIRVVSILVTYRTHKLVAYVLLCILYNKIVPILKNWNKVVYVYYWKINFLNKIKIFFFK